MNDKPLKNNVGDADRGKISSAGIDLSESTRAGSFMQQDGRVVFSRSLSDAVEIYHINEALSNVPGAREHFGRGFKTLNRDYPQDTEGGYFIRVKKGRTVSMPVQACLFLKTERFKQKVHNIIIVEEGASLYLITGCSSARSAVEGMHLGVTEFFIRKGGYLNSTMIHSWNEDTLVRPVSIAIVDENARFVSNYISLQPVRDVTMYPAAVLSGAHARASMNSLIIAYPRTLHDIGGRVIFRASGTQAEIVSRTVSFGGRSIARGNMKAEAENVKAHLECRGLILSREGNIYAVPELETDFRDVDMSHEAAIGRINSDEIEYLRSRGMSSAEAQSIIIRGFMDVSILALPETLQQEIARIEEQTLRASL